MLRKTALFAGIAAVLGALAFYLLTRPVTFSAADLPDHTPDIANGETMFIVGGCANCHAVPDGECSSLDIEDETLLAGGRCLKTDVGTFFVPNISPDKETGIGAWSTLDFVNAMKRGVSPDGVHLYPSFPYTSYQRMQFEGLIDLKAYLDTLPPVESSVPANDLRFPYNIRSGVGLFQRLYVDGKTFEPDPEASDAVNRGAYLVLGPGHCTECHSPRNGLGAIIAGRAFTGAPSLEGEGRSPDITQSKSGIGDWSQEDIEYFLETGSTPDFDVVGEAMVLVQEDMERLSQEDREAIAAFLKTLPARDE
ncbi:MAG: cytochrome c [Pseudomonadota bacterium]